NYKINYYIYKKILKRIRPKAIVEVVSYDINKFAMNQAAFELDIPTIELQHGTMRPYHIAYNFNEKLRLETFPQYILTFGKYWNDSTRLPIDSSRVRAVGWPFFEKKISEFKSMNIKKTK